MHFQCTWNFHTTTIELHHAKATTTPWFFVFFLIMRQKANMPTPKHRRQLITLQVFRQVERRFHNPNLNCLETILIGAWQRWHVKKRGWRKKSFKIRSTMENVPWGRGRVRGLDLARRVMYDWETMVIAHLGCCIQIVRETEAWRQWSGDSDLYWSLLEDEWIWIHSLGKKSSKGG